jgi:hypothetical protein
MRISGNSLRRQIACVLAILLAMPAAEAATASSQKAISGQQQQGVSSARNQAADSNSQGQTVDANASQSDRTSPESSGPAQSQTASQSGQPAVQSPLEQQQDNSPKPVGTAAAPYEKTTGVAASRPAGAVIAPAKQRRARSILIRVSIVVGAAVAIAAVVALSRASPSRPN